MDCNLLSTESSDWSAREKSWQALAVLGALVAVGTIGYHTLEDMSILDALYMTEGVHLLLA